MFTYFSLFFLLGIFISSYLLFNLQISWPIIILTVLAILFSALINFILKNSYFVLLSFCFISLILGIVYFSYFDQKEKVTLPYDQKSKIEGQIVKKPDINYSRQQVTVAADKIGETNYSKKPLILVNLPHYPRTYYGDRITFSGTIEKPGKIEDFDYGAYLKRYLVFGVVNRPEDSITYSEKLGLKQEFVKGLYSISDRFEASLNRILPEPDASLASGLILGIKRNIPEDFKDSLSTTGLTHIIALSGYNVTIIVVVISWILLLFFNRKWVFVFSSVFVVLFVVLTGLSSSVLRAAIFSLMIIFGRTLGRKGDFTNLMLLAALVMVLLNPYILKNDIGFQLSFLAFAGLVYISPVVATLITKSRFRTIPEQIKLPLTETLSAQIAVLPLLSTYFGVISLIAPISNLLVLPIIPLAMAVSFFAGLFGIIYYPIGKVFIIVLWPILEYVIRAVNFLATAPFASIHTTKNLWIVEVSLYIILIFGTVLIARRFKIKIV